MATKPKSTIIHTSIDKLGFKNPNNIARLQKITEKVQAVTIFAQDIHALAVLKHLDNADALDTKNLMSHWFIVQCFLVCTKNCFSNNSFVGDNTQKMRGDIVDVWNEYSAELNVEKIELPYANNFTTYFRTFHQAAIVSTIKKHYYNLLFDTVHKLSGFDNDIKAIELAFKDDNISKTVYDEQISDRKKVHKALREYTTNVLPKDVVDTGADAGLHPDLIQVLSTYSPEFARIGGTINDRIDQHPDEHLWAMLRLNEVRGKHDMSTINILPFDNGFLPKFVRFDMMTIYDVVLSSSERHAIRQEHIWNSHTDEEKSQLPHPCINCSMRFGSTRGLETHRRVTHYTRREFPFKCAECGMPFVNAKQLKKHKPDTCDNRRWI